MSKFSEFFSGQPFTAWQWQPSVRDGCIIWVVEKTRVNHDKSFSVWRLQQVFDCKAEAMNLVSQINNGLDWSEFALSSMSDEPLPSRSRVALPFKTNLQIRAKKISPKTPINQPIDTSDADALRAALDAREGIWTFRGLYKGQERVPAVLKSNLSGFFWRLREGINGRFEVPAGSNSRIQRQLGLHEAEELACGVIKSRREKRADGSIYMRAWVARSGCKWGGDAIRLSEP